MWLDIALNIGKTLISKLSFKQAVFAVCGVSILGGAATAAYKLYNLQNERDEYKSKYESISDDYELVFDSLQRAKTKWDKLQKSYKVNIGHYQSINNELREVIDGYEIKLADIQQKTNEIRNQKEKLENELQLIKKSDSEANNWLNTPIPPNIVNWVLK